MAAMRWEETDMVANVLLTGLLLGVVMVGSALAIDCAGRGKMNAFYVLSSIVTLGLLVYLVAALLRPAYSG